MIFTHVDANQVLKNITYTLQLSNVQLNHYKCPQSRRFQKYALWHRLTGPLLDYMYFLSTWVACTGSLHCYITISLIVIMYTNIHYKENVHKLQVFQWIFSSWIQNLLLGVIDAQCQIYMHHDRKLWLVILIIVAFLSSASEMRFNTKYNGKYRNRTTHDKWLI